MNGSQTQLEHIVIYLAGRVQQLVEDTARGIGISPSLITAELAEVLRTAESGQILGAIDHLSSLQENGAARDPSLQPVEVAQRAPRRTQVSKQAVDQPVYDGWSNKVVGHVPKGYKFNGTHWTQQPRNKARITRHLKQIRNKAIQATKARWRKR